REARQRDVDPDRDEEDDDRVLERDQRFLAQDPPAELAVQSPRVVLEERPDQGRAPGRLEQLDGLEAVDEASEQRFEELGLATARPLGEADEEAERGHGPRGGRRRRERRLPRDRERDPDV